MDVPLQLSEGQKSIQGEVWAAEAVRDSLPGRKCHAHCPHTIDLHNEAQQWSNILHYCVSCSYIAVNGKNMDTRLQM